MLKDQLLKLKEESDKQSCMVCTVMSKMDDDTKPIFIDIMRSKITNLKISQILATEGISISDNTIRRARNQCFRSDTPCEAIVGVNENER